jgi:hypothetical protein
VRGDIDGVDRQTADTYTTIDGAGALSTKPEMMRSLRAGTTRIKSFELAQLTARVYGEVAVLTGIVPKLRVVIGHMRSRRAVSKIRWRFSTASTKSAPITSCGRLTTRISPRVRR